MRLVHCKRFICPSPFKSHIDVLLWAHVHAHYILPINTIQKKHDKEYFFTWRGTRYMEKQWRRHNVLGGVWWHIPFTYTHTHTKLHIHILYILICITSIHYTLTPTHDLLHIQHKHLCVHIPYALVRIHITQNIYIPINSWTWLHTNIPIWKLTNLHT